MQKCLLLYYFLQAWDTDKAFFAHDCVTVTRVDAKQTEKAKCRRNGQNPAQDS